MKVFLLSFIYIAHLLHFTKNYAGFMDLAEYLKENDISMEEFAKLVGTSSVSVFRWATKRTIPRRVFAKAIELATGGKVTARELRKPE